jgi:uncharacterized protein
MMMPVRRDVRFALPADRISDWHQDGPAVTHFMNALSLMFPAGERFFMDAVRHYRDQITDPELKQQIAGFIGQEAMHTREHVEYNDLMQADGLPAHELDQWLWKFLAVLRKVFGAKYALATTISLEHYTAMFADRVLKDPDGTVGGVTGYQQMWMWHAFEEAEHKAVSYDVWSAVMTSGLRNYIARTGNMLIVTAIFWSVTLYFHTRLLLAHRRQHGKIGIFNMLRLVRFVWGPRKGVIPRLLKEYVEYFKPGFHPWDQDNREQLDKFESLIGGINQSNQVYAPDMQPRRVPLHPGAQALV